MSILRTDTLQNAAGTKSVPVSTVVDVNNLVASTGIHFRNRIINGDMRIDQRNNGASVTLTAANFVFPVDRMFAYRGSGTSGAIAQRVASGITGSAYALRIQRNNGDASTAALGFGQCIETNNCLDLAGQNITVSFKARCGANFSASGSAIVMRTTTGTAADQGAAGGYNSTWTGNVNTDTNFTLTTSWQTFSVVVPIGSTVQEILNRFSYTPTGTAGANDWFEVTEFQLEAGSVNTPFERRPYGTELALCQRYYEVSPVNAYPTAAGFSGSYYQVTKRATPSVVQTAGATLTFNGVGVNGLYVSGGATTGYSYTATAEL